MGQKEKPVLFLCGLGDILSGAVSVPGRKLSIASRSPHGHEPEGKVEALVPRAEDLRLLRIKEITQDEFKIRYGRHIEESGARLAPGKLVWSPYSFFRRNDSQLVESGDVLFCTCLYAQKDGIECHRLWAAELLDRAGWCAVVTPFECQCHGS
jgi:hypothetical protein